MFVDTSRVRVRLDERVRSFDGTELSVDLYLPPRTGRYPVLLNRTASDNNRSGRPGISPAPADRWKVFAARGYIVATADVRGRGDSDGQFTPFRNEAADGAATLAWLRKFEECDGRIGLFGSGYDAFCAWAAAVEDGEIEVVASVSPLGAVGRGLPHNRGALRLDWLFWMHLMGGHSIQPPNAPPWRTIHRHLPLLHLDEALGRADIWWREWLGHFDPGDAYWAPLDLSRRIAARPIRGLHVTGWWDTQLPATLGYYCAARSSGAPQSLIVGPWDPAAARRPVRTVGGFDFGPRSVIDLDEVLLEYFDSELRTEEPSSKASRTRVFVTGVNEWSENREIREDAPRLLKLHLSSGSGANTRRGDGILLSVEPHASGTDEVVHNPDWPIEFQPQYSSFASGANPFDFTLDQSHITARDEALVYTTPILDEAVTVTGRPVLRLMLSTDAPDMDVYVLLSDVFPAGTRDLHLSHAAARLAAQPEFIPGTPLRVELMLNDMAHRFLPGHQIRLTVTPSLFPLYACNPQSGDYLRTTQRRVATLRLHHGGDGSAIALPLVREP